MGENEKLSLENSVFMGSRDSERLYYLVGGEPFLNTELGIIIKEVCKRYGDRIGCFQIITNGSVLPSHELLLLLKENNVLVRISDYTVNLTLST